MPKQTLLFWGCKAEKENETPENNACDRPTSLMILKCLNAVPLSALPRPGVAISSHGDRKNKRYQATPSRNPH